MMDTHPVISRDPSILEDRWGNVSFLSSRRPISVLWVMRTFDIGGAERALLELLPSLRDAGVEVEPVAVESRGGRLISALRDARLDPRVLGSGPADPGWVWRLRRLLGARQPNVLHLSGPLVGAGGRLAALGTGVPVVYTEQECWDAHRLWSRWANAVTFGLNDVAIAVSEEVRESISRDVMGRRRGATVRMIPNAIDLDRVRCDAEPPPNVVIPTGAFGSIGHLTHVKGPDVLIQAAAIVQRSFRDRPCILVGGGADPAPLTSLAARAGADVRFLGIRTDARSICSRLGVYVQPSRSEGLPFAVLEAMALGRPIVATAVGGIPEVLTDGVDALLVPPEDPAALAAAIGRILGDPDLAERLGTAARESVGRWSARTTAGNLVDVYRQVLA